jgi:hypothetical protein
MGNRRPLRRQWLKVWPIVSIFTNAIGFKIINLARIQGASAIAIPPTTGHTVPIYYLKTYIMDAHDCCQQSHGSCNSQIEEAHSSHEQPYD